MVARRGVRHRSAALLRRGAEGNWFGTSPGNRSLAEQQGGEFTFAVPTTGAGNAPLPAHAKSAEIRRCPFLSAQPFQPGTPPLLTTKLQTQPCRRSRRVASALFRIGSRCLGETETGSNPSDSTALAEAIAEGVDRHADGEEQSGSTYLTDLILAGTGRRKTDEPSRGQSRGAC